MPTVALKRCGNEPAISSIGTSKAPRLTAAAAKGLEFDAVIVVEPGVIYREPNGPRRLYVALTRAVQHLSMIYAEDLPDPLRHAG